MAFTQRATLAVKDDFCTRRSVLEQSNERVTSRDELKKQLATNKKWSRDCLGVT